MKSIKEMTNAELAAFVESHLRKKGIDVVLSGGACVSIYSSNRYVLIVGTVDGCTNRTLGF